MKRVQRIPAAVLAGTTLCLLGALPDRAAAEGDAATRIGSVVATTIYAPAKLLYAATGVLVGGTGWLLSGGSREALDSVLTPAVQGDYVIKPEHLRGDRPVEFVGAVGAADAREPDLESDPAYDAFGYEY